MHAKAIVRVPGENFADGLTTAQLGKPDYQQALKQHQAYCRALESCGLELMVLEVDKRYPDGCFVEDTAIVTEEMAVITKSATASRSGEEEEIAVLLSNDKTIERLSFGTLDGGDVLRFDNHFYIGLSERTNREGASQLATILAKYGYTSSEILVKNTLHLKSGATYIGHNNLAVIDEFAGFFPDFNIIKLHTDEAYAANCILINDQLLIPKGFPKSKQELTKLGYPIIELDMSAFQKMDGSLTCLSLIF